GALLALSKPPGLPVLGHPGELSLTLLLPALRRRLGLSAELHVVKAPTRECSGLVLLSGCHRTTEEIQQFFTNARRRGQYPATYLAVTVGVPAEAEGEIRTGLCWQQQGDTTMVRGCRGDWASQLPVHLTLLLCPALGDHQHSSRVGKVLGVPFLLPPEAAPTRTQV
ncbi:RUSD3 synthase, partial [Stercorarius parasiticus]|nr:RUSD3 synthase [Stercorarius parasiticus]